MYFENCSKTVVGKTLDRGQVEESETSSVTPDSETGIAGLSREVELRAKFVLGLRLS